jgi:hypothetical protein
MKKKHVGECLLVSVTGELEKGMSEGGEYQRDYRGVASANSGNCETEANGDSRSTYERGWFLGWFLGHVVPVQWIFVLSWLL